MRRAVLILTVCLISISPAAADIDIVFDYRYDANNFFDPTTADGLAARARMTNVKNYFEGLFTDTLAAIIPSGVNHWTPQFYDPAVENSWRDGDDDLHVLENQIRVYVGGRDMVALGQAGPGGYSASSSGPGAQAWFDLLKSRGEDPDTDFGRWGGSISFDTEVLTDYSWNFSTNAPTPTQFDFLSVALHEMGHVLGFGTADSWDNLVSGHTFLGAKAVAEYNKLIPGPVPLDSIDAHWAAGTMSKVNGIAQEAAMDPNIANGQRKYFTDLDEAGLDDLGWEVVPEPATLCLLAGGGIGLLCKRRRRKAA